LVGDPASSFVGGRPRRRRRSGCTLRAELIASPRTDLPGRSVIKTNCARGAGEGAGLTATVAAAAAIDQSSVFSAHLCDTFVSSLVVCCGIETA